MKINKFINNTFSFFKRITSKNITAEDFHIKFLMQKKEYSKIYELSQHGYSFSNEIAKDIPYYFLNFISNVKKNLDNEFYQKDLKTLNEFTYFFKLLNSNESFKQSYLKAHTDIVKDQSTRYKDGLHAVYLHVIKNTVITDDSFNKNTTDFNIEFFKFFDSILKKPNKIPENFILPQEFVFMFLLENPTNKIKDVSTLFNIGDLYPKFLLNNHEGNEPVISIKNIRKYFSEIEYQIGQAKIQNLSSINTSSDDMQSKILKSIIKPQISDISQIQNFIDSTKLSEDIKTSLNMITATLTYLETRNLPSEDKHNINTIKENLYQNLNDYDNVMEFLDQKDIKDYKNIYINMATNLSQVLLNHEKNNLNELEQVKKVSKLRYK